MREKACVLIHGFTGSPKEIEIVAKYLEQQGIDVILPILPGHGYKLDRREMRRANWTDWVLEAEKTVQSAIGSYKEVYLVGFSMGGMIAAYLATKYPLKKLVLLSASVFYVSPLTFLKDLRSKPFTRDQLKRYVSKFRGTPIKATIHFRRLVKNLKPHLNHVSIPTLIIQGEKDDLVHPKSAQYIFDTIASEEKYLHLLPKSKHIICWDCERDKVIELIDQFI